MIHTTEYITLSIRSIHNGRYPVNQTFINFFYEENGGYVDRYQTARYEQHTVWNSMDTFKLVNSIANCQSLLTTSPKTNKSAIGYARCSHRYSIMRVTVSVCH